MSFARAVILYVAVCAAIAAARAAERADLVWPTSNTAWADGRPLAAYVQHAGSGDAE